jgi:hypothetical protein
MKNGKGKDRSELYRTEELGTAISDIERGNLPKGLVPRRQTTGGNLAILENIYFIVSEQTKNRAVKHANTLRKIFDLSENEATEMPDFYLDMQI